MQVNHISKSSQPSKYLSCTGASNDSGSKKVRYKHYYEMEDKDLRAYSIAKAYNTVQNSGKMRLKKALPLITSSVIATSLAITQPGNISTKMKSGLGFLAVISLINSVFRGIPKLVDKYYSNKMLKTGAEIPKEKRDATESGVTMLAGLAMLGATSLLSRKKIAIKSNKLTDFISKEGATLTKELQQTKFGQFIENKLNPFINKHEKAFDIGTVFFVAGTSIASALANVKLSKSISKDFNKHTTDNYIKGKAAQADARAHFDSIDAIEI